MKKSIVIGLVITISFSSCKKEVEMKNDEVIADSTAVEMVTDDHNAMNSLDYQGTYVGSLPCADCEAIETIIILRDDSFEKEEVYKGKFKETFSRKSGSFEWNKEGYTITLVGIEKPNQYFVGENVLFHLDIDGKRIEGELMHKYQLEKKHVPPVPDPVYLHTSNIHPKEIGFKLLLKEKWRLVTLKGLKVKQNNEPIEDMFLQLNSDGVFSAYVGCNSLQGRFDLLDKKSKISFYKIISSAKGCNDDNIEEEFIRVLENVDNYNFDGKTLKLNKARMATLAEFVIIK